jgi:hypothetical protein
MTSLGVSLWLLAACASNDVAIRISSDPEGATVYVDGERVGTAGGTFQLRFGSDSLQQICIQLRKPGCKPVEESWELDEVPLPGRDGMREKTFHLEPIQ